MMEKMKKREGVCDCCGSGGMVYEIDGEVFCWNCIREGINAFREQYGDGLGGWF
jgi:hypothetical protein